MSKNKFLGKDFEILNHSFTVRRTPIVVESVEFDRDLETGKIKRDKRNQPISYPIKEYKMTENYKFTFVVKCPDGSIRTMKKPDLVNTFGKRPFKRAYDAYYELKAEEFKQLQTETK